MSFIMYLISRAFYFYSMAVLVYCLMSWFPGARDSKIGEILSKIVDPYLDKFRRLPLHVGGIDFSPWVALFVLQLAQRGLFIILTSFR
jgi:YggT family protein